MNEKIIPDRFREAELDLSDLFWSVLSKWKTLLLWSLIIAILAGAAGAFLQSRKLSDYEYLQKTQILNDVKEFRYESASSVLEEQIRTLRSQIEQMSEYEQNSPLFAIDPFHVSVTECSYFVDAGFQIDPNLSVQDPDYALSVIAAYSSLVSTLGQESIMGESVSLVQAWRNSNLLIVRTLGKDAEESRALMGQVQAMIDSNKAAVSASVHEHRISLIGINDYEIVSDTLLSLHEAHLSKMNELTRSLKTAQEDFGKLGEPELDSLDASSVLRKGIKGAILGLVGGFFAAALVLCGSCILRSRITSADDVSYVYRSNVLAVVESSGKRSRLDRKIRSHLGIPSGNGKESLDLAAENIRLFAGEGRKVLLAGSAGKSAAAALAEDLAARLPGFELRHGGDLFRDNSAVSVLSECDGVVLVETISRSSRDRIWQELQTISRSGKPFLGFLLTEPEKL